MCVCPRVRSLCHSFNLALNAVQIILLLLVAVMPKKVSHFIPALEDSRLGRVEYDNVSASVSELANPTPAAKKGKTRGRYTHYSAEDRASIGRYALENGNEKARQYFLVKFPNLKESTIRNFKKAYKERMDCQQKQLHSQPVTKIMAQPRGRPPILQELDTKLIKFLRALRRRGGVINIHVVRAATQALIESNSSAEQLRRFNMPRSWVQSIYRCMGYTRRMRTTTHPPVPQDILMNAG